MTEKQKQKKLNKLAKEWDHDFAKKLGEYKGSELWTFDTNDFSASGFPLFVLVDDSLAKVITPSSKEYDEVFKFSGTLPDDDDEDD